MKVQVAINVVYKSGKDNRLSFNKVMVSMTGTEYNLYIYSVLNKLRTLVFQQASISCLTFTVKSFRTCLPELSDKDKVTHRRVRTDVYFTSCLLSCAQK